MNTYFLLNNLHFASEVLGALAFIITTWLALDAYLLRKNFFTASRSFGFLLLVIWQIIHAFNAGSEALVYLGYAFHISGLAFVLLSFFLEPSIVGSPTMKAIVFLPPLVA